MTSSPRVYHGAAELDGERGHTRIRVATCTAYDHTSITPTSVLRLCRKPFHDMNAHFGVPALAPEFSGTVIHSRRACHTLRLDGAAAIAC